MNTQQYEASTSLQIRVSARTGSPLDIRCAWGLANLLSLADYATPNPHGFDTVEDCMHEAEAMGYRDGLKAALPQWFVGTPLASAWDAGAASRCECEMYRGGSKDEWDALSPEARSANWESFHEHCAAGVGDRHYFFELLMKEWMVGYVGH